MLNLEESSEVDEEAPYLQLILLTGEVVEIEDLEMQSRLKPMFV